MTHQLDSRNFRADGSDAAGIAVAILRSLSAVMAAFSGNFLRSLHESRRRQAKVELAKYRHLISEPAAALRRPSAQQHGRPVAERSGAEAPGEARDRGMNVIAINRPVTVGAHRRAR